MTVSTVIDAHVWIDLGQRIERALECLATVQHDPVRITSKIEGVQAAQRLYVDLNDQCGNEDVEDAWVQLHKELSWRAARSAAGYQQGLRLVLSYMSDYR